MVIRRRFAHNTSAMPVYLFTFHAYRSWREDNPNGYVQRGRAGIQPPNKALADYRAGIATHKLGAVVFRDHAPQGSVVKGHAAAR